jgi:hypothetical protein
MTQMKIEELQKTKRTRMSKSSMNYLMDVIKKTMDEMPKVFTSHEFNAKAIKNGYPEGLLQRKGLAKYIRKYADNGEEFSKTWTKIPVQKETKLCEYISENDTELMIFYLKKKGYKIMKPVSEWVEC